MRLDGFKEKSESPYVVSYVLKLSFPRFKMRRLAERRSAAHHPIRHPGDEFFRGDRRRSEQFEGATGVAQQRRGSFGASEFGRAPHNLTERFADRPHTQRLWSGD